jgi:hypothetical protein
MNVLLTKDYRGQKAGKLLTDITASEAGAIERLGLGEILKEEKPKAEPARKGDKASSAE